MADMLSNNRFNPVVTESFIRVRKLNISNVLLLNLILLFPKIFTHYFTMKIPNTRELKQTAFNHSLDINFQDFMNLYKECTIKPYFF